MRSFIRTILEINAVSFKWYLLLSLLFFIGDWDVSGYWLIGFLLVSGLLKLYSEKIFFQPWLIIFLVLALWTTVQYQPALAIIQMINNAADRPFLGQGLMMLLFILAAFSMTHREIGPINNKEADLKEIYRHQEETVREERLSQKFPLRRYAHLKEFETIISFIEPGETVLDNGCGDGTLAIMLAKKGALVTACDIAQLNISRARSQAEKEALADKMEFLAADAENLPFADDSFSWVISSHVLEHLPNFEKGLAEVHRITKKRAIIALPTCLNPCAVVLLGGDNFWEISRKTLLAWLVGLARLILNLGGDGVNEHYRGDPRLPHLWRYPWVMRRQLRKAGFKITSFQASSLCLPYFNFLLPLIKKLDKYKAAPFIKNFGYGSIAVVEKL